MYSSLCRFSPEPTFRSLHQLLESIHSLRKVSFEYGCYLLFTMHMSLKRGTGHVSISEKKGGGNQDKANEVFNSRQISSITNKSLKFHHIIYV